MTSIVIYYLDPDGRAASFMSDKVKKFDFDEYFAIVDYESDNIIKHVPPEEDEITHDQMRVIIPVSRIVEIREKGLSV